jgi:hypothetical protein
MNPNATTLSVSFEQLDDPTVRYIQAVRPFFEDIREAACLLAGLIVMAAADSCKSAVDQPTFHALCARYDATVQGLCRLPPPPMGIHFHYHLIRSAQLLRRTIDSVLELRYQSANLANSLEHLKTSWRHLRSASIALPGFSLVELDEAYGSTHSQKSSRERIPACSS